MINSALTLVIGIIASFLDSPLVVMLILGFLLLMLLFFAFNIFPTSLANKAGNASFTHRTSSIFDKVFVMGCWNTNNFYFSFLLDNEEGM